MKSFFILSSERSGTNLLRALIGRHSQISAPVAPHLLITLSGVLKYYGDLDKKERVVKLIKDALRIVNHSYHDWGLDHITPEEIYEKYFPKSLIQVKNALFSEKANSEGKSSYFSKELSIFNYYEQIIKELPEAKSIYLYRDPRDIVASWLRTPLFMHTPYQIISNWEREQQLCIQLLKDHPNTIYSISYERLIKETPNAISDILNFLDIEIETSCFKTDINNKESRRNEFWKNLSKPIISSNSEKYLAELTPEDIYMIESQAKKTMIELDYTDFQTMADMKGINSKVFEMDEEKRINESKKKNQAFYEITMKQLKSKLEMQKGIYNEISELSYSYIEEIEGK